MKGKSKGKTEPRTLTGSDWEEINKFAIKTGLRLLFDVNGLKVSSPFKRVFGGGLSFLMVKVV